MRFALSAAALVASLVSSVLSQETTDGFNAMTAPTTGESVPAGEPYTVKWTPAVKPEWAGPITLSLLGGASPSKLVPMGTIGAAKTEDGEFVWSVDATLGTEATYGIKIALDSDPSIFQYSFPFKIVGGSGGSSSVSSSSVTYSQTTMTDETTSSYPTTTPPAGNYSTTMHPPKTTTTVPGGNPGPTGGSTVPPNAAGQIGAPLALVGGLVLAALAL